MLFSTLGPSSLPVVVAQPDERHANRAASVLEWYDRHRAIIFKKNSATSCKILKTAIRLNSYEDETGAVKCERTKVAVFTLQCATACL